MLNRNLTICAQHINLKWFNTVKKNEKMQCERNVWHFTSRELHHFSWAVSVTLSEQRFVHRATPWGSAPVQGAAHLPWAEFSSVPAANLAVPASSSWLLRDWWVLFFTQTHLHRRWILEDDILNFHFPFKCHLDLFFPLPHCFTFAIFNYRDYQKILP